MNREECAELLRRVSAFDNRKPDPYAVEAWMSVLGAYSYADCLDAVVAHHSEADAWCMPIHIKERVRKVRSGRIAATPTPDPPPGLSVGEYQDWLRAVRTRIADGWVPPKAVEGRPIDLPDILPSPE